MPATDYEKLYHTRRWKDLRGAQLRDEPMCVMCRQRGKLVPANVVDHIRPHRGDASLFWDRANLQSVCKLCHDSAKKRKEAGGVAQGCDLAGMPLDHDHHWRKG